MFQNVVVGVASAFIRILYTTLFGLLLLFRLDRVVLMKGFEQFDEGHKSYIGFLYLEHTLNNPVLCCFVDVLLAGQAERNALTCGDNSTPLTVAQLEDMSSRGIIPYVHCCCHAQLSLSRRA